MEYVPGLSTVTSMEAFVIVKDFCVCEVQYVLYLPLWLPSPWNITSVIKREMFNSFNRSNS